MDNRRVKSLLFAFILAISITQQAYALEAPPGVTERTGQTLPLEAPFVDDNGEAVTLGGLIDRPTVLSFAYFGCTDQCNTVLSSLAAAIGRTGGRPGADYLVLTVSFDESDTPRDAAEKKRDYTLGAGRQMDGKAWRFLTGGKDSIAALAGAAGFSFRRTEKGFDHPAALAVLSPDGRITRYIYGNSYLPSDIEMAIEEAAEGRITASIKKALLCFSSEPEGRANALRVLRAAGVATLVFAALFFIYVTSFKKPGKKDPR